MPVSWRGTLVQYAGRLHRSHQGKVEVRIYDYVEGSVPMLARMFDKRLAGYRAMGCQVADAGDRDGASEKGYVIEHEDEPAACGGSSGKREPPPGQTGEAVWSVPTLHQPTSARRKLASDNTNTTAPITASATKWGHTTDSPAPR